jgi:hypothetical protein
MDKGYNDRGQEKTMRFNTEAEIRQNEAARLKRRRLEADHQRPGACPLVPTPLTLPVPSVGPVMVPQFVAGGA